MLAPNENVTTRCIIFSGSKYILMALKLSTQLRNLVSKQVSDHTEKALMKRFALNLYYCFIKTLLSTELILRRK
jgi:hypothetical protein